MAFRRIQIGKQLIGIQRPELRAQVYIQIPFGKGGPHGGSGDVGNGGQGFRA